MNVQFLTDSQLLRGCCESLELSSDNRNIFELHDRLDAILGEENYKLGFFKRTANTVRVIVFRKR